MASRPRFLSIELFKALGIVYLVYLHELVWVAMDFTSGGFRYEEAREVLYEFGYYSGLHVLGVQVPLLAGMTYFLALRSKYTTFFTVLKRAAVLLLLGYSINLLSWGWIAFFDWDVLQFIAFSMVVSYPVLKKYSSPTGVLMIVVIGCVALAYSNLFPLPFFQNFYAYDILIGSKEGEHFWPFCPWYFIFAVGILMGKTYYDRNRKFIMTLPLIGFVLVMLSAESGRFFPALSPEYVWSALLFKPSPLFVCGIAGMSLIMVPLASMCFWRFPGLKTAVARSPLMPLGRGILWVFLLNTTVGYRATVWMLESYDLNYGQAKGLLFVMVLLTLGGGYVLCRKLYSRKPVEYVTAFQ